MWWRLLFAGLVTLSVAPLSAASTSSAPRFGDAREVVALAGHVGTPSELETADLNGDRLADVVIARLIWPSAPISYPLGIFLADGRGGFVDGSSMWDGPPLRTEVGRQIVIADFNGDHRNDIFVADTGVDATPFPGHQNELALSTPRGRLVDATANLPAESEFSHSAAAADVNGDGTIDLFVGNICCGPIGPEFLLNDGTGRFTRRVDLLPDDVRDTRGAARYTRSLLVDVNGDRAPDLVLGADDHTVFSRVLLNDGAGHFRDAGAPLPPKPLGPNSILISLASLDANQDGRPDLLAGFTAGEPFYVGNRIQVLIGNVDGTFRDETEHRLPEQAGGPDWPTAFRFADFNHDGRVDFGVVVVGNSQPLYLDDGAGVYRPFPFTPAAWLFGVVDPNADGRPDIFSAYGGNGGGIEGHALQLQLVEQAAPSAPLRVRARAARKAVSLAWPRVVRATSYEVWRSDGSIASRRLIGRSVAPHFHDARVAHGMSYRYVVRARNAAGVGPFSASIGIRVP